MIVVIADKIPNAVRGKMKLWFLEPKPNVFVSSVSDQLALKVIERLMEVVGDDSGMLIVRSKRTAPGYELFQKGDSFKWKDFAGMQLVAACVGTTCMAKKNKRVQADAEA